MKKIYKIIASISIFLIVLFVGVVLVVGNTNKKANAGVIIDSSYVVDNNAYYLNGTSYLCMQTENAKYFGLLYTPYGFNSVMSIYEDQSNNSSLGGNVYYQIGLSRYDGATADIPRIMFTFQRFNSSLGHSTISNTFFSFDLVEYNNNQYIVIDISRLQSILTNANVPTNSSLLIENYQDVGIFFDKQNVISSCTNIYDLENKSFCLLYLSDISGISTTQQRDEITINWGFIDTNDNTLYSEYAPTIKAQNLAVNDDTIIRLVVPLNNNGSTMDYYDISQKALLSTIDSSQGGATATAHIYGIYIWRSLNMIEWGLAEFDTTSTPTSGASMNYLTSTTRLYQYQNMETSTMTCRISASSNFNFITIKNQEQVNVSSVNAVIRQGGFMPAWSLYNWARGSHSGFTSGEQYGTAQYQPGSAGYNAIYQAGRQAGINENIGTQNWFIKIFEGVDSFLNIRIFPNITFGVLLGIPFVISVVWFIIRSFRGGGGS